MHLYIVILYFCAGITLTLAAQAWFRRKERGATALLFFLLSVTVSSFCYAMNLGAATLVQKQFWNHAEYLGSAYVPTLMLVVALAVTGRDKWLRPLPLVALFFVPVLSMLANWSNAWHGLYYARTWLEPSGSFLILAKERGPLYALKFGYTYVVVVLALVLLLRALRRPGPLPRPQLHLLLAAFLVPLLLNVPYTFRLMPHQHVNLTLAGFFCSAILLAIAIFRFRLISPLPLDEEERNQLLLNHVHACLYTIRPDGIMTYVSPNWHQLLGHTPNEVVGKRFTVFVPPEDHPTCHAFLEQVVTTGKLQTGVEYRVRHKAGHIVWHTSSIIPVKDKKGHLLAYVGAAHDITHMKHTQQELTQANDRLSALIASREAELHEAIAEALSAEAREDRRIGEDIHDGLCQDLIGIVRLAESIKIPDDEHCRPCRDVMSRICEQSSRLACVARDFSHDLTLHELDFQSLPEALETLARRTDQLFQTETELNVPEDFPSLPGEHLPHIYRIIREAVANAVKHARAEHLWIDLVRESRQLVISVSNDGHSLPEPDQLKDGLGMKQMRMRARLLGGTWSIRQNEQNQTIVELVIPLEGVFV